MVKKANISKVLIRSITGVVACLFAGVACAGAHGPVSVSGAFSEPGGRAIFIGGVLAHDAALPDSGAVVVTEIAAYGHLMNSPGASDFIEQTIDPIKTGAIVAGVFNSVAIPIRSFPVSRRWERIMRGISECAGPGACAAQGKLLDRIAKKTEGKPLVEKVGIVNAMVNGAIRYQSDQSLYGKLDYWAMPAEILSRGSGDCEDFAILKMTALMRAGLPPKSLSLVVLRDNGRDVFHAVLAVTTSSGSFILDNARPKVARDGDLPNYQPLYSLSEARAWIHGTRTKSDPAVAQNRDLASIAPGEGPADSDRDDNILSQINP